MRVIFAIIALLISSLLYAQENFAITLDGLHPKAITTDLKSTNKEDLYAKTLNWINSSIGKLEDVVESKIENELVIIQSQKENAIEANKQFFHLQNKIKISFKDNSFTFTPIAINTKVNSKYDMGWQEFDLENGSKFFKKGKVIKKTKSYVTEIPKTLNALHKSLIEYLNTN